MRCTGSIVDIQQNTLNQSITLQPSNLSRVMKIANTVVTMTLHRNNMTKIVAVEVLILII